MINKYTDTGVDDMLLKNNKYIQFILVTLIGVVLAIGCYMVLPKIVQKSIMFSSGTEHNVSDNREVLMLSDKKAEHVIIQNFVPDYAYITAVGIKYAVNGTANRGNAVVEIWDGSTDTCIASVYHDMLTIKEDYYTEFRFPDVITINPEHNYYMKLTVISDRKSNALGVYTSNTGSESEDCLVVDDSSTEQGLCYGLYGYNEGCTYKVIFLLMLIVFCVAASWVIWNSIRHPEYDSVGWIDIAAVIVAFVALILIFHQGWDVAITIRHAKDLLLTIRNGEMGEFYTKVLDKSLSGKYAEPDIRYAAVYNFGIYFITMIIMLPFWITEHVFGIYSGENVWLIYFDVILAFILCLSAYIIYKIVMEMTSDKKVSKNTAFIYLSSYTVLYATIGFCQFDLFYIIFMELSLLYYLRRRYIAFSLLMSVSVMLKMFPIIIFVPLVLLFEKRIVHIIKYMGLVMVFPIFSKLLTHGDIGYSFSAKELSERYGFANRLFASGLNVGIGFGAIFIIAVSIVCIWCFDHQYNERDCWKYIICIPLIVFTAFFVLVYWHPGWFIMLMPFLCIACGLIPRRSLLYCEWGIGLLASILSIIMNPLNVDNYMVNYGILPVITGYKYQGISLATVLQGIHPNLTTFISSLLVALLSYACYSIVKDVKTMESATSNKAFSVKRGIVMTRPISIYAFSVLLVMTYFYAG